MKPFVIKLIGNYLNVLSYIRPNVVKKKGFKYFTSPIRLILKPQQLDFLNSAENIDLAVDDETVRLYKWGDGPKVILFCHGWQSHSFRWIKYIHTLKKKDYTIYAMDGPASGQTTGKTLNVPLYSHYVEQVKKALGKIDFYVGHSLGAFAILYTAYRLENINAKGIVVLACPGSASDFIIEFKNILGLNKRSMNLLYEEFKDRYKRDPSFFDTVNFVKEIDTPGLIIHDIHDTEAPYSYIPDIHKTWKNSQLITTSAYGHKLRSNVVVDHVVNFIETIK